MLIRKSAHSNTAKGAEYAKNDFHNLRALCVLCGDLSGNEVHDSTCCTIMHAMYHLIHKEFGID
ncbi:MAG: hypothetical protein O8C55_15015 [Candidatus Methanoperedens sp.]|nr:hypothetical protein [Candidatus Methanoperedens sp.]